MGSLHSRAYTGHDDLQSMIRLTSALRSRGQRVYPIAADLFEELSESAVQESARLWENDRRDLAGFVYVSQFQNMVYAFDKNEFTPAVENEMVEWAAEAMQYRNRQTNQNLTLDASVLDDDLPGVALLERHDFERQTESSILMARPLDQDIPEPQLPPGFSIRPMGGEAELEAYVALHQAAFGTSNMTVEYRRTIMNAPDYLPELDLVGVAPDGDLAAFCVCQIFPDDTPRAEGLKEGWTDPVGTHPAYQRMGLAKALLLIGMELLKKRGMDTALLGTGSSNIAMQKTASAAGFKHASTTLWYSKKLD